MRHLLLAGNHWRLVVLVLIREHESRLEGLTKTLIVGVSLVFCGGVVAR
jgi:hypothetical protein